jgi:uncharacterized Zn finger protein (UPF0148 family)
MLRHTRLTELAKAGVGEAILKSYAGWTQGSTQTQIYLHLSGRDHIDPVLVAQGLAPNHREMSKPIMEILHCPKCDAIAGAGMVYCPKCGYILDEKMKLESLGKNSEFNELKLEVKQLHEWSDFFRDSWEQTINVIDASANKEQSEKIEILKEEWRGKQGKLLEPTNKQPRIAPSRIKNKST